MPTTGPSTGEEKKKKKKKIQHDVMKKRKLENATSVARNRPNIGQNRQHIDVVNTSQIANSTRASKTRAMNNDASTQQQQQQTTTNNKQQIKSN
jgi:hypothetical protein